ncbi:MAG: hypothetical protein DRG24_05000 [Epsilonproteobacteria bacterium]|nr:MAG: hypothetical protein DRG24_05000 [Campylobacterota bacterium]
MGILFLKFGLGAKVAGAKTLTHAIVKAGGHKAIAVATTGMLAKRHIIDLFSKFFTAHSVSKYKQNLITVLKLKANEIKNSPPIKRLKAFGSMLLSIPMIYFFWTKVLGTAIQKIVYALIVPLFTLIWNLLITSLNILTFIFQVLMLNVLLDVLANYRWGKVILNFIDRLVYLLGSVLNLFNKLLSYLGINPKSWLIKLSMKFNAWLERILDQNLPEVKKIRNRRDRYINGVESISEKRYLYLQKKRIKRVSVWKQTKILFTKSILKKKSWQEIRQKKVLQREARQLRTTAEIRRKNVQTHTKRHPLLLPYAEYQAR